MVLILFSYLSKILWLGWMFVVLYRGFSLSWFAGVEGEVPLGSKKSK